MKQKLTMMLLLLGVSFILGGFGAQWAAAQGKIVYRVLISNAPGIYVMNSDGTNQTLLPGTSAADNSPSFSRDGNKIVFSSTRDGNREIYVMNPDGSQQTRLTNNSAEDFEPSFSSDRTKIVFGSWRDGNSEIYIMNADGSNQTRLTSNTATEFGPSISPDGTKIIFISNRDGNEEIYSMNPDGSNQTRLTNEPGFNDDPSFSADGSRIIYASNIDGDQEIFVMNADGTNRVKLTDNTVLDVKPSFSPDGAKIAFLRADSNEQIYVMNADGTNQTNLSNNSARLLEPSWGNEPQDSDGDGLVDFRDNCPSTYNLTNIAFESDQDIFMMDADGSNPRRLTDDPAWDTDPTFSPDGSKIAFTSLRDGNAEIYVMNADGSNLTRLTDSSAQDYTPSFSPDSSKIVFISVENNSPEIYVMNADGTNPTRLTDNSSRESDPSFSPDGSKIVFAYSFAGDSGINIMNSDGSNPINLTNNSIFNGDPVFSPDGSKIAFHSWRNENAEIIVMNSDGSNQINLTNNTASDGNPTFSPDGSKIAFHSWRDGNPDIYVINADGTNQIRLTDRPAYDENPSWSGQADSDGDGIGDACDNKAPFANNDSYQVNEDNSLNEPSPGVLLNDTDYESDTLNAMLVSPPAHAASFTLNPDGSFSYTPAANYFGSDSFTYKVSDGDLESDIATAEIIVHPVNDAPGISATPVTRQQTAPGTVSTIANVSDADNASDSLIVMTTSVPAGIFVTSITNNDGTISAAVAASCNAALGINTVGLKVTDGSGAEGIAYLTVNVTKETTPPVIDPTGNITVYLPAGSNAVSMPVSFPLPTASDNCSTPTVSVNPVSGSQFSVGTTVVNVTAADGVGNQSFASFTVTVLYRFSFFDYANLLSNPQYFIQTNAGSNVAVRFSLSGFKGDPYSQPPTSQPVSCTTKAPLGAETAINRFAPDPFYSSLYDFYQTTWRTQANWRFTCRRLTLYFKDGSTQSLDFYFK